MKKFQKLLDQLFPHQYVITDTWEDKDDEYDVYGIYSVPHYKRTLGNEEILREVRKYSPDFIISKINSGNFIYLFTRSWPGSRLDPPGSEYMENKDEYLKPELAFVGMISHIMEEICEDWLISLNEPEY